MVAAARDRIQRSAGPRCAGSGAARGAPAAIEAGRAPTHEARGVPELVGEVAAVLELRSAEPLVVAGRRAVDQREAQRVGAGLVDRLERVDDVALRLRHLLAVGVADQAGEVDRPEGLVAGQLDAQHHHPGDPEEDDVVARLHDRAPGSSGARSAVSSGQPRVENGHRPELNQVSKMSGSWVQLRRRAAPQVSQAGGPVDLGRRP